MSYLSNLLLDTSKSLKELDELGESLNSPVDYSVKIRKEDNRLIQTGNFKVSNFRFEYLVEYLMDDFGCLINFEQILNNKKLTDDLNNLNTKEVLQVFSTILKIMEEYSKNSNFIFIQTSSEKKMKLYLSFKKYLTEFDTYLKNDTLIFKSNKSKFNFKEFVDFKLKFKNSKIVK